MGRPRNLQPNYRLRVNRSGCYVIAWSEGRDGRCVSTRTRSRAEAEAFFARWKAGLSAPVLPEETIGAILDAYLETRRGRPSHGSMRAIANILRPRFGALRPGDLTQGLVKQHADERLAAGRSRSTIVSDLIVLRSALNWAVRNDLIPGYKRFIMPVARNRPRDRWLTKEEAARLAEACMAPHIRLFVLLGLSTMARREAILTLTWDRVDLTRRLIHFEDPQLELTNKRRGVVPINDRLLPALQAARARRQTAYVVEYGGDRVRDVRTGLEAAAQRAGVGHVHPHMLKHSSITWAVMEGVPLREIARMAATSEAIIERVYGHHAPDYLRRAAASVEF